ncbi:MAG: hypothetical protein AB1791_15740 [Chloroflexota bacterium]
MSEQYVIELKYGTYGLPDVEYTPGAKLSIKKQDNTYTIYGNELGLLFLAHNLIALAKMEMKPGNEGYHIHLDDLYALNVENIDLILRRET